MGTCRYCGKSGPVISDTLGFCVYCVRGKFRETWPEVLKVHKASHTDLKLPTLPPFESGAVKCTFCDQECRIAEGNLGYCGSRSVSKGKLVGGRPHEGSLRAEIHPLPFICSAAETCSVANLHQSSLALKSPMDRGRSHNLCITYQGCSFNCLYCSNTPFRSPETLKAKTHARQLSEKVTSKTRCLLFRDGGHTPQILHALKAAEFALKQHTENNLRICWETSGGIAQDLMKRMANLSLRSGGHIIFHFRAWSQPVHFALCGLSNIQTLKNFEMLAGLFADASNGSALNARMVVVPGYIDDEEVKGVARFIEYLDPNIPLTLMPFYPAFYLKDIPGTSRTHAERALEVAGHYGLRHARFESIEFLGDDYEPERLELE